MRRLVLIIALLASVNVARAGEWFIEFVDETGWVGEETSIAVDSADWHEVSWSCADVDSGVYLYRLETEAGSITQRLVVSR